MAASMPPSQREYQLAHLNQGLSSNIVAVNIALPIVATIAVILRLTARRMKRADCKADDFVLVAALVSFSLSRGATEY